MLHADILIPIIAFLDPRHQLERALDVASSRNDVRLLRLLVAHCKTTKTADPHYTHRAIDQACAMGHLEILDCWKESGLRLKYSPAAMDDPSRAGHVSVLQWWKDSRLKIKYSVRAVDGASRNGQVPVLEWWKDSGYHMKYSVAAVDGVLWGQSLDVLRWWERSGLELRVTERRVVSQSPWSDKYRWWMAHRARINRRRGVDPNTVDWAVTSGRLDVLQVWLDAGVSFRCTRFAIHTASARGMVNVLQWWKDKGLPFAGGRTAGWSCATLGFPWTLPAETETWRFCSGGKIADCR
ncbi:hypothetical protein DFJ73DRAFT_854660 [Zopfochytrium polystomum]|nr:hypothetical protein DFJ73DRAFT_854660 [Zopfochytrium polystomum]